MSNREEWCDYDKGILICLVVLGHTIQYYYCKGDGFWDNELFRFIYSFHMPLFSMISGYLFYRYVQKYSIGYGIYRRFLQIMIPCFAWSTIDYVFSIIIGRSRLTFSSYCHYFLESNWFLWAMFYRSVAMLLADSFGKIKYLIVFLIIAITYVLPDYLNSIDFKMMFPFFVIGFLMNEKSGLIRIANIQRKSKLMFVIGGYNVSLDYSY